MIENYKKPSGIDSRNTYERQQGVNKHMSLQRLKENSINLTDISSTKLSRRNYENSGRHGSNPTALKNLKNQHNRMATQPLTSKNSQILLTQDSQGELVKKEEMNQNEHMNIQAYNYNSIIQNPMDQKTQLNSPLSIANFSPF